jgi:hypothetical protein
VRWVGLVEDQKWAHKVGLKPRLVHGWDGGPRKWEWDGLLLRVVRASTRACRYEAVL